jgi:hypothetical protein
MQVQPDLVLTPDDIMNSNDNKFELCYADFVELLVALACYKTFVSINLTSYSLFCKLLEKLCPPYFSIATRFCFHFSSVLS